MNDNNLMSEPKLISELTKAERKRIGRKVLNATIKNAPPGTMIYGSGDLILPDGSKAIRTGKGRGKNSQYRYIPPEGTEPKSTVSQDTTEDPLEFYSNKKQTDQDKADITKEEISLGKDRRAYDEWRAYEPKYETDIPPYPERLQKQISYPRGTVFKDGSAILPNGDVMEVAEENMISEVMPNGMIVETPVKPDAKLTQKDWQQINNDETTFKQARYAANQKRDRAELAKAKKTPEPFFSQMKRNVISKLPYPMNDVVANAEDNYRSVQRLRSQIAKDGVADTLSDIGNGLMGRLASVGSDKSAKWWRDKISKNSEAGRIGSDLADEAMFTAAGGAIGKAGGKAYKQLRRAGEAYGHRVQRLAQQAADRAKPNLMAEAKIQSKIDADLAGMHGEQSQQFKNQMDDLFSGKKVRSEEDLLNEDITEQLGRIRQRVAEGLTKVPDRQSVFKALANIPQGRGRISAGDVPYSHPMSKLDRIKKWNRDNRISDTGGEQMWDPVDATRMTNPQFLRVANTVKHNIKNKLGERGMYNQNQQDLDQLWSKIGDLNKARRYMRNDWNQYGELGGVGGFMLGDELNEYDWNDDYE